MQIANIKENKDVLYKSWNENREDEHNTNNATDNQNLCYWQYCIGFENCEKKLTISSLIFREKSKRVAEINKLTDFKNSKILLHTKWLRVNILYEIKSIELKLFS